MYEPCICVILYVYRYYITKYNIRIHIIHTYPYISNTLVYMYVYNFTTTMTHCDVWRPVSELTTLRKCRHRSCVLPCFRYCRNHPYIPYFTPSLLLTHRFASLDTTTIHISCLLLHDTSISYSVRHMHICKIAVSVCAEDFNTQSCI